MLEFIRRYANSIIVKLFLGILAITFIFCFGISDIIRRVTGKHYIVKVGNIEITPEQFRMEKARSLSMLRGHSKNIDEKAESSKILYQIIWESIVDLAASDFGLIISDNIIEQYISNAWKFRDDTGRFNANLLRGFLRKIQIPEQAFIEFSRKDIKKALINFPFSYVSVNKVLDTYIKASKEKRNLIVLELNPASFQISEKATQEDLDAYINNNPELFSINETRSFRVLEISEAEIEKNIKIPLNEIEEAYEFSAEKDSKTFDQMKPELIASLKNEKLESEINNVTRHVEDALMGGEPIEEVVKKFNLKTTLVENVDANNKSKKSAEVLKINYKNDVLAVAFSIDEGTDSSFSEAIDDKGNRILWLVHLDRINPKHTEEFSKISDRVNKEWIKSKQAEKAVEFANKFIEKAKNGENLATFASKNGRISRVTRSFDRNGQFDDKKTTDLDDLIGIIHKKAFSLEKSKAAYEEYNGKIIVYQIKDIIPAKVVSSDKDKFEKEFSSQISDDFYQQLINYLSKRYKMKINEELLKEVSDGETKIHFDEMF